MAGKTAGQDSDCAVQSSCRRSLNFDCCVDCSSACYTREKKKGDEQGRTIDKKVLMNVTGVIAIYHCSNMLSHVRILAHAAGKIISISESIDSLYLHDSRKLSFLASLYFDI